MPQNCCHTQTYLILNSRNLFTSKEEITPYYIGIKRDNIEIHLSELYGDSTPGSKVFIICDEIEKYYNKCTARPYKYYRPCLEKTFYGALEFSVQDPFGNKLSFNEYLKEA